MSLLLKEMRDYFESHAVDNFARIPPAELLDWCELYERELIDSDIIERARKDPNVFIQYCFRDKDEKPLKQGKIHSEWHEAWSSHKRVLIEAPRDHGKTSQAIGRVLWEIGNNPNLRIKLVCQSDPKARERLGEIRSHIMQNPRVQQVFPNLIQSQEDGSDWNKHKLNVKRTFISKDASIEAHGILSSGTGGRADLMLFDDVVDMRNAILIPALRAQVKTSYYAVWINLLEPEGRAWYIGTPWHSDDLTHEIRKSSIYHVKQYPVGANYESVWPEGWTKEQLMARADEIGPREFDRSFRLVALSDEDMSFPSFVKVLESGRGVKVKDVIDPHAPIVVGVDLSSASRKGTSIFVLGKTRGGQRLPVEIRRGAWKSPDIVRQILDVNRLWKPQIIHVENNALQSMLVDWLKEEKEILPVKGFTTGTQKSDPRVGVQSLEIELHNNAWCIPWGEFQDHKLSCECGWCEWVKEMKSHPIYVTTDTVMSMWFAREAIRNRSVNIDVYTKALSYKSSLGVA